MTPQERWDSLTPAQKEETCAYIMAHFNQAKSQQAVVKTDAEHWGYDHSRFDTFSGQKPSVNLRNQRRVFLTEAMFTQAEAEAAYPGRDLSGVFGDYPDWKQPFGSEIVTEKGGDWTQAGEIAVSRGFGEKVLGPMGGYEFDREPAKVKTRFA